MEGSAPTAMREGSQEFVLDGSALIDRNYRRRVQPPSGPGHDSGVQGREQQFVGEVHRPTTIIMSTKSGTNEFHGSSVRDPSQQRHRQSKSASGQLHEKPPHLNRNEFGGSAGGPLILPKLYNGRNRTFWFAAYEGYRNIAPTTQRFRVPTEAMRERRLQRARGHTGQAVPHLRSDDHERADLAAPAIPLSGPCECHRSRAHSPLAKYLYRDHAAADAAEINPHVDENWWGPMPNSGTAVDDQHSLRPPLFRQGPVLRRAIRRAISTAFADFGSLPALNNVAEHEPHSLPTRAWPCPGFAPSHRRCSTN